MRRTPKKTDRSIAPGWKAIALLVLGIGFSATSNLAPSDAESSLQPPACRLLWLVEPGAEESAIEGWPPKAASIPAALETSTLAAAIPETIYVIAEREDGTYEKRMALACDAAPRYGAVIHPTGIAVAGQQGDLQLWRFRDAGHVARAWRSALDAHITSIGWDGGERLFAATRDDVLYATSAVDGRILWTAELDGRTDAPPVLAEQTVFVATKSRSLLALDTQTGARRWLASLPGPVIHMPAIGEPGANVVFCVTWDGQLCAVNAASGALLWTRELTARSAGAPLAFSDSVVVVTADGQATCYDSTGEIRWQAEGVASGSADLKLSHADAPRVLIVSNMLAALDPSNGMLVDDYPRGAIEALKTRFLEAMIDGEKTYGDAEKHRIIEEQAFSLRGDLQGTAILLGDAIAFGTDEGWIYLFDAHTLRPRWRYHAGASSKAIRLVNNNVLASAGHDVFAYDRDSGRMLWRRNVGAVPDAIAGDTTLAVLAGNRLSALDAASGVFNWRAQEKYDVVAPRLAPEQDPTQPTWIAGDASGRLEMLSAAGSPLGASISVGGPIMSIQPIAADKWLVAAKSGFLTRVAWQAAPNRLAVDWEMPLGEAPLAIEAEGTLALARSSSGISAIDMTSKLEIWSLAAAPTEVIHFSSDRRSILICGENQLRALRLESGEVLISRATAAPPLAADWRDGWLVWLDRSGQVYRSSASDASILPAVDLAVPLTRAEAVRGGFIVTSEVGEVGFVDVATGTVEKTSLSSSADSPTGGIRP